MTRKELKNSQLNTIEKYRLLRFMNQHRSGEVLSIAARYSGIDNAVSGKLLDITPYGLAIECQTADKKNICHVSFQQPIRHKSHYIQAITKMTSQACTSPL